ncbi:putative late blight resistance protein homolog R1A-10 [Lycium barbarum]|uniref:putative late blight resistance protein homolog R1A-10 n=1 Tax=Lycium barbarum TaxID=112863 RepID=UPI00293E0621|nr:putative late blight resistance protein homolog R1A-10 [Lycium barbarum]
MDDIWSKGIWDLMTRIFPDDNNGRRIILTSRPKEVAELADPDSNPPGLSLLNSDNSWKLLHDQVFGSQHVCPPELENVGKKIAQKCQGLPLALLVVAGHLSKISRTRECWDDVAKRISKIVASEPDKCLGVLGMSYSYLRDHLKACFLYMGVFPEDFEVQIRRLIQLWVAEGFLRNERLKSLEEAGKECLEDLIGRNLIMVRRISSFHVPSTIKLQNLEGLSDLSISCCTKELFSGIPNLKRLKIHGAWAECTTDMIFQTLNSVSCLNQLEILKIICSRKLYAHRLPSKYALPISLKMLTLCCTYLPWEDMANIVMLPNLLALKIKDNGFDGDAWRLSDEEIFNQLKFLLIHRTNMKRWEAAVLTSPSCNA